MLATGQYLRIWEWKTILIVYEWTWKLELNIFSHENSSHDRKCHLCPLTTDIEATEWQPKSRHRGKKILFIHHPLIHFFPPPFTPIHLILWNAPIPRYLSPSPPSQSVSVSHPLSSTSPLLHLVACPPHLTPPPFTWRPSGEPCQSQAYKRGLDMGLGGQPAPLCSLAQRRMKLACGGPSMAVGHSRHRPPTSYPLDPSHLLTHLTSILPFFTPRVNAV